VDVKILFIIVGGLMGAFVLMTAWFYIRARMGNRRNVEALLADILPVISALREGRTIPQEQITQLAKRPDTRGGLYQALSEMGHASLFPGEYAALPKIAESHLVVWLLHPHELGAIPDGIELVKDIERQEGDPPESHHFFVFKFRTNPPHWAAKSGWMAGVAGPYAAGQPPLGSPSVVFSRLEAIDSATPEEHLGKIEKLFSKKQ
jgi:diadenosine tetraphosphatase ApaH/serine/threonine PP2A family protein phosphatase